MASLEQPNPVILDVERVRDVLRSNVDPGEGETFEIQRERPDARITGLVVRNAFRDVHVTDRQRWIWDLLRANFGPESSQIGLVLAFTPEEFEEYGEDARAA